MNSDSPFIVAIVQARMGSSRLPGKVLRDIAGEPMLVRVVERARKAELLDQVIVATSVAAEDDAVADLGKEWGFPVSRGSAQDVLDRYVQAARQFKAEIVVRITGDCPLIDPGVIDQTIKAFLSARPHVQYASNRIQRTYPIGLDVEVFWRDLLEQAALEAKEKYQREHVTPYFYEPEGRFQVIAVHASEDYGELRWTVDTAEDLAFVREIYSRMDPGEAFDWHAVLAILKENPALAELNAHVRQKDFHEAE